jgi:glucose-1-phosphate thymidylyltransferase
MDAASEFVRVMEKRTDTKIACLEEIAFLHGFITKEEALIASKKYGKSTYGEYIKKIVN